MKLKPASHSDILYVQYWHIVDTQNYVEIHTAGMAFHIVVMPAYCGGCHIIIFSILDNLWPLDFTEKNKKRNMSTYAVKHEREKHIVYRAGKGKGKGTFSGGGKVGG